MEPLYDLQTALRVTAERSFLKTLGGGCSAPVAVSSKLKTVKHNQYELSLNGAVWSLNGKDEVNDTESACLIVNKDLRCATCPYKNGVNSDIENIECSKRCPLNTPEEPVPKRQKIDVPLELLRNDPHDQCPIQIPVGADFMGKCPYLESQEFSEESKCPVSGHILSVKPEDYAKCPYLKENSIKLQEPVKEATESEQENLFCGLVLHKDATFEGMTEAKKLGERLAHNLISKGALEIMTKAQAVIHSQTAQNVDNNIR